MPQAFQGRASARRGPVMAGPALPSPANRNPPNRGQAPPASDDGGPWLLAVGLGTVPDTDIMPPPDRDAAAPPPIPKPMYHRVAALAFLRARIVADGRTERLDVVEWRAGGRADTPEADLLAGFWRSFEAWKPRLVTFNGRGFLLPVLKYRSMRHRLSAGYLHQAGDRWSGYGNRYALTHHVDLMDVLSDQRASPFPALVDIARSLGLPHRGCDGDEAGKSDPEATAEKLRADAEADVATLFLAYVRWRLLTGHMSPEAHDAAARSLRGRVEARIRESPALSGMLEPWPA